MTHVVKFSVTSTIEKFQTKDEFFNFDYKVNNDLYSVSQWIETQKQGLENNWIFDRSVEFWDTDKQELTLLIFCRNKESAEKFLKLITEKPNFQEALINSEIHGLYVNIAILEGSTTTLSENFDRT